MSDKSDVSGKSDVMNAPDCPLCGKGMRRRTAGKGPHAGQTFWGGSGYPECKGTRKMASDELDRSDKSDQGGNS